MADRRSEDWRRHGACIGCGGGTYQRVQMLSEVWLFVCHNCDSPDSVLADKIRELQR